MTAVEIHPTLGQRVFISSKYDNVSLQAIWGQPLSVGQSVTVIVNNCCWITSNSCSKSVHFLQIWQCVLKGNLSSANKYSSFDRQYMTGNTYHPPEAFFSITPYEANYEIFHSPASYKRQGSIYVNTKFLSPTFQDLLRYTKDTFSCLLNLPFSFSTFK